MRPQFHAIRHPSNYSDRIICYIAAEKGIMSDECKLDNEARNETLVDTVTANWVLLYIFLFEATLQN